MKISRTLQKQLENSLFQGKVVILYGARRTGKTTLVQEILSKYGQEGKYLNCESWVNQEALESMNPDKLKAFLGDYKLIVLDEAQSVSRIGHVLKLLVDTYPEMQSIATGSSSFELANQTGEPLVGRSRNFLLYPLSLSEIKQTQDLFAVQARLENLLRFGSMPSVYGKSEEESIEELDQITSNYLYKDILVFEGIKKSQVVRDLLKAIAFQLGNEVSFRELAKLLDLAHDTVAKYIDLLEKSHIIFTLPSLSRNPRNEIKRGKKIYFYDVGVRNSLIQNYNPLSTRGDVGALWENFCILERMKKAQAEKLFHNQYFWRSKSQKEVDYIEEYGGRLHTFEFKWNPKNQVKIPKLFQETYPDSTFTVVNSDNYWQHLLAE